MREWATPSGGGGKLKFFAHKNNYTKHLVNLIREYITAKEHGDNVGDEVNSAFKENRVQEVIDTIDIMKYALYSSRNINGILSKRLDSLKTKIIIKGSAAHRKKLIDSIKKVEYNQRESSKYWLNQK